MRPSASACEQAVAGVLRAAPLRARAASARGRRKHRKGCTDRRAPGRDRRSGGALQRCVVAQTAPARRAATCPPERVVHVDGLLGGDRATARSSLLSRCEAGRRSTGRRRRTQAPSRGVRERESRVTQTPAARSGRPTAWRPSQPDGAPRCASARNATFRVTRRPTLHLRGGSRGCRSRRPRRLAASQRRPPFGRSAGRVAGFTRNSRRRRRRRRQRVRRRTAGPTRAPRGTRRWPCTRWRMPSGGCVAVTARADPARRRATRPASIPTWSREPSPIGEGVPWISSSRGARVVPRRRPPRP